MSSVFEGKSITKTILKIGLLIIMSIACVFGMGGSSVIARQLGEGNKDYSAKCLNFCIYSIAIAGPLTLALGLLVLTPFSYVIGADDGNLGYTRDYLKWIFMGAPFVMLANSSFLHLTITVLRNVALFIPGVIILNYFWQLDGVILTQLVVEGDSPHRSLSCDVRFVFAREDYEMKSEIILTNKKIYSREQCTHRALRKIYMLSALWVCMDIRFQP